MWSEQPDPGPAARLFGVLLVTAGALVGLHLLGSGLLAGPDLAHPATWWGWLAGRSPTVAAFATVRLLGEALTLYLLVVTGAGLIARLLRLRPLIGLVDAITIASVRRFITGAVTVSIVTGAV